MLTLLLFAQAVPTSDAVLDRFERFIKKTDLLAVTYSVKLNGQAAGTMNLLLDRPNRMKALLKTPIGDMVYVINETGALEVSSHDHLYAQHPSIGRLYLPPLKVVPIMTYAISQQLVLGNRQLVAQPNGKPTVKSKVMVGNVPTDEIYTKTSGMGGETQMKCNIDAQGRLMKFWVRTAAPNGATEVEHVMSSYTVGKPIPSASFETTLPLGYSPFGLARADYGLPQGDPVPTISLKPVSGGRGVTLKSLFGGKNTIVVVTDPGFHANGEMLRATREVLKQIPNSRMVVVGMRKDAASARAIGGNVAYYDPTGLEIQKLGVPGAPCIYLFDSKGNLAQMFFGFDGTWEDLDKALARLKK
jgi:hypothetical protein